ncbi:hypothetical protein [Stakelama tenebrarum]|uniref:Uncharacterized protein n=1 Tax=Stakelama tenebrarum TaxID=2711215 RepID=A0A6G6Y3C7_9SPHN|nr:hypothetical protein [Sphingosinithalassobacter tenebrarum]QIG79432.1 hypothetical protein G5C33_06270 [Sphingosinithalassobacter tenebrarum]
MRTRAAKRYQRRFFLTMVAYVAVLFASVTAINQYEPTGLPLVILSVLPALPVIACLVVMGFYLIEETDEFVRQRIVSAMMFGTGVVLSIATVLGFLQYGKVIGNVDVFWAFPIWCMSWGFAQCWLTWRDSRAGGNA